MQVSCVQMHWTKPLEANVATTLRYVQAAAECGSRVVLFPEASLTSYYFPYVIGLDPRKVQEALDMTCRAAGEHGIWVIAGTIQKTPDRYLNIAHIIAPDGRIAYEYASTWPDATRRPTAAAGTSSRCLRSTASLARSSSAGTGATPNCIASRRWLALRFCSTLRAARMKSRRFAGNARPAAHSSL